MTHQVVPLDEAQTRLLRGMLPVHTDQPDNDVDGVGEMRHALMSCRTPHCLDPAEFRYTFTLDAGLISERSQSVYFCDYCWREGGAAELGFWKMCGKCDQALTPSLDEDVPTCLVQHDPVTGDVGSLRLESYRALYHDLIVGCEPTDSLLYHNKCGTLCNVCCRFVIGDESLISPVEGLAADQRLCVECRAGQANDKLFLQSNSAIVSHACTDKGLRRFIRPVYPGPRTQGTTRGDEISRRYSARLRGEQAKTEPTKKRPASQSDEARKAVKE